MARRLLLLFAIGLAGLTLVAAGCGGGGDESSASEETALTETTEATTEEATTEEAVTEETTTEETTTEESSAGTGFATAENCQEFAQISSQISSAITGSADVGELKAAFEELTAAAPDEIKGDFETLSEYVTAVADAVGDGTPTAEDLAALQGIDATAATTASQNIATWATENCGAAATP